MNSSASGLSDDPEPDSAAGLTVKQLFQRIIARTGKFV
jgi:hypothetical protein